jgi:hypothetical protein
MIHKNFSSEGFMKSHDKQLLVPIESRGIWQRKKSRREAKAQGLRVLRAGVGGKKCQTKEYHQKAKARNNLINNSQLDKYMGVLI